MAGTHDTNPEFALRGINHLALVCRDMQETVEFYTGVLGMKLVKTLEYANGSQHFFLDMGNGRDALAFFPVTGHFPASTMYFSGAAANLGGQFAQ